MLVRGRESPSKANELRVPPDVQTGWAAMIERRKRGGLAACTSARAHGGREKFIRQSGEHFRPVRSFPGKGIECSTSKFRAELWTVILRLAHKPQVALSKITESKSQ
jgi:hypothetical protein